MDNEKIISRLEELDIKRVDLQKYLANYGLIYYLIPLVAGIVGVTFSESFFGLLFGGFFAIISSIVYYTNITGPFKYVVEKVKKALVTEYMRQFHPEKEFYYQQEPLEAKMRIRRSKLITADIYEEEDVLMGTSNGINFYISEVHLRDEVKRKNSRSTVTIFDGILFELYFDDRQFPTSKIESKPNLLDRWFGETKRNEAYNFWYETTDEEAFACELESIFPFINYLVKQQGDVRISTEKNRVTILMQSDMKFMDSPSFRLSKSFLDEEYFTTLHRQLNTLFYILETFGETMTTQDIEEKLELRALAIEQKLKSER